MPRTHCVIPDTQVAAGVPLDHLEWIGRYIVEKQPDVLCHLGDHPDMKSLSSYDRGKIQFEGRRYKEDIKAARKGWDVLNGPIEKHNKKRRKNKERQYKPRKVYIPGNHDERIDRAIAENPILEGTISRDDLGMERYGWEVADYLKPVEIDGVFYAHYFYNPMSGRPLGGKAHTRLNNLGFSFTMGHQQGLDFAIKHLNNGDIVRGLIAGSCYLHKEGYLGPQAQDHWNGIIFKHEVEDGNYCIMEISLDYLCRKYAGVPLKDYEPRHFA